ncbi:tyrosine-type recombinase/integrase [Nocardia africana]|uniref:Tyrosine recombinase XerD n=1 Tax=Nocardia africana TaxID=134964 RepID=A0A378X6S1_9NOCA|nr:tyrosine-type recombinase/integrase [Nocardia africana]MCC3317924.1 tyrosine-type recombinase/integrase [Nocardia africana]SUA48697.1 Tyrosine recombinase XerD [Nocardia africana]
MPLVHVFAASSDADAIYHLYLAELARTGRGSAPYYSAARTFLQQWPNPQDWAREPLEVRLSANSSTRPFITFLMLHDLLRPGYDYLLERKVSSLWREIDASPIGGDLAEFLTTAHRLGFTQRVRTATGSQAPARLLIQTGRRLRQLTVADLDEFADACRMRRARTGKGWHHYKAALANTHLVLFHLGVLPEPPRPGGPWDFAVRLDGITPAIAEAMIDYLHAKRGTCTRHTVSSMATRLTGFGRFLTDLDPTLARLAQLDRRRHIEPWLASLPAAVNSKTGEPIGVADHARRVVAVNTFLTEITEWGWTDAPKRKLLFRNDVPRLPKPLPRYIPVDADRHLTDTLRSSDHELAASALLLARACGLRIGELLDLEIDCVHEIPGEGAWLKVPLGKLDTERMVPLDEETVELVDRIIEIRSPGKPLTHPRTGKPAQFLFTHHGGRLAQQGVRLELDRAAATAGIGHVTPHQLRHTYATALVNAGVSLQSLMALLGHVSAQMSLRYGKLFDTTVRTEYERALTLTKDHLAALPTTPAGTKALPLADITGGTDWTDTPALKSRLAGGFCLRAPAQGACPYANICEHCPNFRTDATYLPILAAQRTDARKLADDAQRRGWITEAERHHQLIARLDATITDIQKSAG